MNNNKPTTEKRKVGVDEIIMDIGDLEIMSNEVQGDLLQCEMTEEEKNRILQMVSYKMQKNGGRGRKRTVLIAALIAVFAFATTAFAAEIFHWDSRISNYFGIDEKHSKQLAESGMNVGIAAENENLKIEAVQTIGDGNNLYILLNVTAPEGKTISPNSRFDMIYLQVEGASGLGYGCEIMPDEDENDNKATMLFSMEANKKINNKKISISFKDLGHYEQESLDIIVDFPGELLLEWELDYKDVSKKYTDFEQNVTVKGQPVKVDSISISPIAINITLHGSYFKEYDSAPPEPGSQEPVQIKKITLKDGTFLTQDDASSWGTSTNGSSYVLNMQMREIIDVESVKSVTLNDVEITL